MASIRSKTQIDPIFSSHDLALALGVSLHTLTNRVTRGQVPPPDLRTLGNCKNWKFSTIRNWNPAIATKLVDALKTAA